MHDLVGVAAQQELAGVAKQPQDQGQLRVGKVLHFVHHREVVARFRVGEVLLRDDIRVVAPGLPQPGKIALEQVVHPVALVLEENRAFHAERGVFLACEPGPVDRKAGQHALEFLEQLVRKRRAHPRLARQPVAERAKFQFPARRHPDRLDQFPEREKLDVLLLAIPAVREIKIARVPGQEGRPGDVEHVARDVLHLLQRERGLAAPGRADDRERRRQPVKCLLGSVEGEHLVQQVEARVRGVDVGKCGQFRVLQRRGFHRRELRFVHLCSAQEARFLVGVVLDDLQQQSVTLAAVARDAEQQAVRVVEPGAVQIAVRELLHFGRAEVVAGEHLDHLLVAGADAVRIEVAMDKDFHLLSGGRGFRRYCGLGGELHGWDCNSCGAGIFMGSYSRA
ncbi:MAG: hypothetical protein A3G81_05120 [Betaproteobacteria bacterium RIFCSPLOWO2_12_FULL_65_14]|nr:MAG: hypothetical protein A3G81_05120 [Betaproteobacteria bacterium RIFCSPLOWO2_12_FULL_65_14]